MFWRNERWEEKLGALLPEVCASPSLGVNGLHVVALDVPASLGRADVEEWLRW